MTNPTGVPILLATIGAAHGVRGEVRVKSFTAEPMRLADYSPLSSEEGRPFEIETSRPGKGVLIVKFRGVDDRNAAEALNGMSLYSDRDALPDLEEDEFYHADLIGLAAVTEAGEPLGTIVAVHDFGAGDILDIAPPRGPSRFIAFTKANVPEVDLAAGRVMVRPPPETEAKEDET